MDENRTLLFISYAWEDTPAALWVARKLTAYGYKVWMDKLKLYGGRIWPEDIEVVIKEKSIRMIHLLSHHSLHKTNPRNERQMGFMLSKAIPGYLIPLNLEGIPPPELPWQMPEIQYIDFREWHHGFAELLKALQEGQCPVFDIEEGVRDAINSYLPITAVKDTPETLYSNVHPVLELPGAIRKYRSEIIILREELDKAASGIWPTWYLNRNECLAFNPPPESHNVLSQYVETDMYPLATSKSICGIDVHNLLKSLLDRTVRCIAYERGFVSDSHGNLVFPQVKGSRYFNFRAYDGQSVKVSPHGYKTIRRERINYSLAFRPKIVNIDGTWSVLIALRLCLFDNRGNPIDKKRIPACRKPIARSWWNHEWFVRQMAMSAKLAGDGEDWLYRVSESEVIRIARVPVCGISQTSLDDEMVSKISRERNSKINSNEMEHAASDVISGEESE